MARPTLLTVTELTRVMTGPGGPQWDLVDGRLTKTVECRSFAAALDLVMAVGALAEEADHHPDIDIRWRTVSLALVTHDAGGLTELDIALARAIDGLPG